jgi:hypothetical protein
MRLERIRHEFVEFIPNVVEDGVVYVSIPYATAVHRCCCGCGQEIVTPLSPTDWGLAFNGGSISLDPSVGSWGLPCTSHYWITWNQIVWAKPWTFARIEAAREKDRRLKDAYFRRDQSE